MATDSKEIHGILRIADALSIEESESSAFLRALLKRAAESSDDIPPEVFDLTQTASKILEDEYAAQVKEKLLQLAKKETTPFPPRAVLMLVNSELESLPDTPAYLHDREILQLIQNYLRLFLAGMHFQASRGNSQTSLE